MSGVTDPSTEPRHLLAAGAVAGVEHHVVLSVAYGDIVHVAPVLTCPVSTDDVATTVAHVAVGVPLFGVLEVAGPEEHRLDDLTAKLLAARGYLRDVVADAHAPFFGATLGERTLLPGADARLGHGTFAQWLARG